ncbi:DNA-binding MarR family transcriptional regulator [Streptacidiphilus sp. MAP12-33]|uniref:MarR family winged helix-turn-helix transcriptional regulator n=1 Tax=Streptacidiphilus sp. MAP12-33 TaxID=3156266 RepID=UPI003517A50F
MATGSHSRSEGFDQLNLRLGQVIKRAEQALITEKSKALRQFGLTVPQYAALMILARSGGASGATVARECMVTPQTMSTILNNLEQKGLIERETSHLHAKVLVAKLSRSGRALTRKADKAALEVEQRLSSEFSETEESQLRELLERAVKALGGQD